MDCKVVKHELAHGEDGVDLEVVVVELALALGLEVLEHVADLRLDDLVVLLEVLLEGARENVLREDHGEDLLDVTHEDLQK